jgi:hypothetical protein
VTPGFSTPGFSILRPQTVFSADLDPLSLPTSPLPYTYTHIRHHYSIETFHVFFLCVLELITHEMFCSSHSTVDNTVLYISEQSSGTFFAPSELPIVTSFFIFGFESVQYILRPFVRSTVKYARYT